MRAFIDCFVALDRTTRTAEKVRLLTAYFEQAPPPDAAWAVFFLAGDRLRRMPRTADLRAWVRARACIEPWLVDAARAAVGDLAETLALLLPDPAAPTTPLPPLADFVQAHVDALQGIPPEAQRPRVEAAWDQLDATGRLVYHKMLRGGFRLGVSRRLLTRALAALADVDPAVMAHRLMGTWAPTPEAFAALLDPDTADADASRPYPFFLAHPLQEPPADALGPLDRWRLEWKYDGIRAQLIRRDGDVFLWSRGEAVITPQFPELAAAAEALPDGTVLDGEIVGWRDGLLPFADLQRRLNRKRVDRKLLDAVPVALLLFDLLEADGTDLRTHPLDHRVDRLARLLDPAWTPTLQPLDPLPADSWDHAAALRDEAADRGVEGLMLKRRDAPYGVGRPRGPWWKWKTDPYTLDAVLLYARPGSGIRASLYTDYSFGLRGPDGAFVKFADAYSGLTDAEIREVDRWIRRHTTDRFGPVRQVEPRLVFEVAFEGVRPSSRHKAGLAVRFPRIVRWRRDRTPADINTLDDARALLPPDLAP